jgi:hypothetical protein
MKHEGQARKVQKQKQNLRVKQIEAKTGRKRRRKTKQQVKTGSHPGR